MGIPRAAWLLPWLLLSAGCNQQDTQSISRIGKKLQTRVEVVTGDLKASALSSWNVTADGDLSSRVAARLRWDKQLAGEPIEVVPTPNGVELKGRVGSLEQHRRAFMLAQTTAGVDEVKDSLVESER